MPSDLFLPHLSIRGFRGITELVIPRLGRVTLLAGKNSVGKTTVLDAVRVYAAREVVGILMDANDSPDNRWQAVANQLLKAGIDTPGQPDPAGTVIDE